MVSTDGYLTYKLFIIIIIMQMLPSEFVPHIDLQNYPRFHLPNYARVNASLVWVKGLAAGALLLYF